ncbi:TFP11-domain-containing protein [Paxillus ammoniavirescens]|nr:TFP11-domain-containing protein [Paxillus ammoniavirescens]
MGRRKRQFLDDSDSNSDAPQGSEADFHDNDPDARDERALFEDPYQRKRRRKSEKEDAVYGVFGEDSDEMGDGTKGGARRERRDWTKAPAFVSGKRVNLEKDMDADLEAAKEAEVEDSSAEEALDEEEEEEEVESDNEHGDSEDHTSSEPTRPSSPRVREAEEEEEEPRTRPRFGGIGSAHTAAAESSHSFSAFTKGGIGSGKSGIGSSSFAKGPGSTIGFTKGVIGSSTLDTTTATTTTDTAPSQPTIVAPSPTKLAPSASAISDLPTSFGAVPRVQRAFLRSDPSSGPTSQRNTPLPAHEQAHFHKIGGTIGAQMLAKMGWQTGTGLGTSGEGIVTPIESKLRPKNAGIAYKGFKEKTEQSKLEARRRGELVSDDEELPAAVRKAKEAKEKRSDAWKKPRKIKTKVEHKTYEQIVAEAGQEPSAPNLGQIIDATGRTPREVASLAEISMASWTPSTDPTRIPEVRHNIRLVADACKTDLDGLAREAKALEERKRFIAQENVRLQRKVADEAELISRLQQVTLVVDEINAKSRELASVYEATLDDFSPLFSRLLVEFTTEFDRYRLDEIVVAAIAPIVRRIVAQWNPLEDPSALVSTFRTWKQALKVNLVEQPPQTQIDVYGTRTIAPPPIIEKPMTPFESLLWNIWLPKVRTSINNEWDPSNSSPAIKLYETWASFLPPFVRDNMLDQLILPKLVKAVSEWNSKRSSVSLRSLVFPWLPHLGLRVEDVLDDARRKIKSTLRSWVATDGLPQDLGVWRDVFDSANWDALLLKYVVPKLASHLRDTFRVNPRAQDMEPLTQVVLPWSSLLRGSIMSQLLETEFFPKWLDVLHIWLIQPRVSFEEVAQWYAFWKSIFGEDVLALKGIQKGFTRGLQLMNEAIELGADAPTKLKRPDIKAEQVDDARETRKTGTKAQALPSRAQEITFRTIVEDFAAEHNLLFIPTGRAHEKSRMPLFRVSGPSGKGGMLVFVQDDAVWAPEGDEYRAITLEEMVVRANK